MPDVVVYLGPTLSRERARSILDVECLPPIRRGDLQMLDPSVRTIGIVDGEFYQNLAVSPKEILPLIKRGIRVYGASSMGALRAAELHTFGMVGIGRIFEAYRDEQVYADDEVALAYDPVSYRSTSEPFINIRFSLDRAVERNLVGRARADETLEQFRRLWFPDRSYALLEKFCPELKPYMAEIRRDQKAEDALLLLRTIRSSMQGGEQL
jgi:hypothetical protein